ncbi:hypothetical protein BKA69DRAFT_1057967 [Paraphysoderma sedebokerense]|nr:hypothetical protein BKA69DRAFT_1057967 [Paraphysoderma sedebokerense]
MNRLGGKPNLQKTQLTTASAKRRTSFPSSTDLSISIVNDFRGPNRRSQPALASSNLRSQNSNNQNANQQWSHDKFFEVNNAVAVNTRKPLPQPRQSVVIPAEPEPTVAPISNGGYKQILPSGVVVGGMVSDAVAPAPQRVVVPVSVGQVGGTGIVGISRMHSAGVTPSASAVTIRVSNLHRGASIEDIKTVFSHFGDITECRLQTDAAGQSLGIATISYTTRAAAQAAMQEYHNRSVDGKFTIHHGSSS